jgi:glycosyltransferase involved in cell wall biosynthesis
MSTPLRILVTTDAFPPVCGGSGWSTWELVRGLTARGHHVEVVRVGAGSTSSLAEEAYEAHRVTSITVRAPSVPFVRNVVKNEQLWRRLAKYLAASRLADGAFDIVHAQHVMSTVPSIRAGLQTGVPVVATVRDYWPVCYWSDLIYDPEQPQLCGGCSVSMMTRCVRPRAGAAHLAAWPLIPYMRANLATKRQVLGRASAVIAVSSAIARDLAARAPELRGTPLYTIPNPVDMTVLDAARGARRPQAAPYVVYAGKLATNKGVQYLLPAIARAAITWPIVVIGDGPLRGSLETEARDRGIDLRILGWRDRAEVWAWMRHASMLAFPSYGPESLSRVLIEAAALGVPIAAMSTGGTPDIIKPGETGLLSSTPEGLARDLATLAADERLRARLGTAARADVHVRFSAHSVVERIEQVYRSLLLPAAA